ncbi:MAG TPA: DUF1343 domain-containing protein, partial [Cyclobacteriaceae bacterium]|nr:DUF1343 domain-containing protein [Cyclobacteriaceae bacterium]
MSGLDVFTENFSALRSASMAVLANHAAFSSSGLPTVCELLRNKFSIKKIFSPEHGISAQGEDGKEQLSGIDKLTGLPVISLYGQHLSPKESDLADVEYVVIDLPNIGCRFYTYWWTLTYMVESCARFGKKVIILDRPNMSNRSPTSMEGPMLDEEKCNSFLGRWRMPLTYSYSYGELIQYFIRSRNISVSLDVVSHTEQTPEVFVPPSPSMSEWQTTLIYPGTGLFEGLNINSGRGTAFPFRVMGAPWINHLQLFQDFTSQSFTGIKSFPYSYRPEWSRYGGEICHGLYFYVEDHSHFQPVRMGLWLMNYLSIHYPDHLQAAIYPTVANPTGENHLDRLLGMENSFSIFCSGKTIEPDAL